MQGRFADLRVGQGKEKGTVGSFKVMSVLGVKGVCQVPKAYAFKILCHHSHSREMTGLRRIRDTANSIQGATFSYVSQSTGLKS